MNEKSHHSLPLWIVIPDLGPPKEVTIPPNELDTLCIDHRYQRDRIEEMVSELVYVLAHGGVVPNRVVLSRRPDGSRYIIDGQQRWWAHREARKPMRCIEYSINSVEIERDIFLVLNKIEDEMILQLWNTRPKGASPLRCFN